MNTGQPLAARMRSPSLRSPFTLMRPSLNLQSASFHYVPYHRISPLTRYHYPSRAKIKYKVKAECVVPGILKPNVRGKAYLTVHQLLSKLPSEVREGGNHSWKHMSVQAPECKRRR